jgi:hypothetical protein
MLSPLTTSNYQQAAAGIGQTKKPMPDKNHSSNTGKGFRTTRASLALATSYPAIPQ